MQGSYGQSPRRKWTLHIFIFLRRLTSLRSYVMTGSMRCPYRLRGTCCVAIADEVGWGVGGGEAGWSEAAMAVEAHVGALGFKGAEPLVEAEGVRVMVG